MKPISDHSSSSDDSADSDDNPNEVIWAKAAQGVWGMAHVFDGKLYFTRDHMQGNFIPKNLKLPEPKKVPKRQPKAYSKASSSAEHVQLFRMVYDRKKGFKSEHFYVSHASLLVGTWVFMSQTLSCASMPLGTWTEVKVQSYHALTHVCVGSCICRAQATALSKVQQA